MDASDLPPELQEMLREHAMPPAFSDDSLALSFTDANRDRLRYVAMSGKWYEWTGTVWREDTTLHVFSLARDLCRGVAAKANESCRSLASSKTVNAVVSLARADRRTATRLEQWDSNPLLLNTPDGTIMLETGAIRDHEPADYITMSTSVGPGGECPLWHAFLDRVTDGDLTLQAYLQRAAGYFLTGLTTAHALFFLFGLGANGKSVFINTLTGIMADYYTTAPMGMLVASRNERHPTELAGLVGKRLVTAIETEQGTRWDEAKVKALTGGDTIPARFMRQDYFIFVPRFKLLIAGNHKPALNSVDEAMRRRFNLVPFTVTIPEGERDEELGNRLKEEWPGILQWAVTGCVEWRKEGLNPPPKVTEATQEYLDSQNTIKNWLSECTMPEASGEERSSDLFASWKVWCDENGERAGSNRSFSQSLKGLGVTSSHDRTGTVFYGLRKL